MSEVQTPPLSADLSGQTALVTGASRGIGAAVAKLLAQNGAKVACVARSAEKLAETVAAIREAGGDAEAYSCDVTSRESVEKVVDDVVEKWKKLDILVNNAGLTRDTLMPRMSDDEWDDVINTNLRGRSSSPVPPRGT
jgi:3-oxoacyl-[acyl-carrier protein] reductase